MSQDLLLQYLCIHDSKVVSKGLRVDPLDAESSIMALESPNLCLKCLTTDSS